jgi:hypothetical protein
MGVIAGAGTAMLQGEAKRYYLNIKTFRAIAKLTINSS